MIFLEYKSIIMAKYNQPYRVRIKVVSLTHALFASLTLNLRLSLSGAGALLVFDILIVKI